MPIRGRRVVGPCEWCQVEVPLAEESRHRKICPKRFLTCSCGKTVLRTAYKRHKKTDCPDTWRRCPECYGHFLAAKFDQHVRECGRQLTECDRCHKRITQYQYFTHMRQHWFLDRSSGGSIHASSGGLPSLGKRR